LASLKLSEPLTSLDFSHQNSILSSLKSISDLGEAGYSGYICPDTPDGKPIVTVQVPVR
jgi:hypothetical protein